MVKCLCGKEYKTDNKFYTKHIENCDYVDLNIDKVYMLGYMIDEVDKRLFHVHLSSIRKYAKENNIAPDEAKKELQKKNIYKYRKSLWDILQVWKDELLASEFRHYIKWVFKTYKDITLISLRSTLSNYKIIYRYNLENTAMMIGKRVDESLIFIHEYGEFSNDFEFISNVLVGNVSMYYILFNDWLASKWFSRLDIDLQHELQESVEIASKTVL